MQKEMRGIGVVYQDKYAVEETFQLLNIPWEWYDSSERYEVVIGRDEDLKSKDVNVNLIDLSEDDIFIGDYMKICMLTTVHQLYGRR